MTMKALIYCSLVVITLINYDCKNRANTSLSSDFDNYIKRIPRIELPYYTSCGSCCVVSQIEIDTILVKKFNPNNLEIIGKLVLNNGFIGVLYAGGGDYLAPGLFVYDLKGNKLSEQAFMGNLCGRTGEFYGNYYLEINEKYQFIETDSIFIFKLDSFSNNIIDTVKKEINILEYEINEKGEILKKKV